MINMLLSDLSRTPERFWPSGCLACWKNSIESFAGQMSRAPLALAQPCGWMAPRWWDHGRVPHAPGRPPARRRPAEGRGEGGGCEPDTPGNSSDRF